MSPAAYKPPGWPSVAPRIFTPDAERLVAFVRQVFAADGVYRPDAPTELRIDDSVVMISDGGGAREPTPAFLYVYVPDADAAFERALAAGAIALEPPRDLPYGDRRATVRDPWNNHWQIATRKAGASGR